MTDSKDLATLDEAACTSLVSEGSEFRLPPEKLAEMRAEIRRRLDAKRRNRRRVVPHPPPRYDDVFFEGVRQLFGDGDAVE